VAGKQDAAPFLARYGVTEAGNFEGSSILYHARTLAEAATACGVSESEARERIERVRAKLLAARAQRVRPHRDDKVITAWNGLMISAFARGARVLGDDALRVRAERAAEFIWARLHDERTGDLLRRWRDGEAKVPGQLDDRS